MLEVVGRSPRPDTVVRDEVYLLTSSHARHDGTPRFFLYPHAIRWPATKQRA